MQSALPVLVALTATREAQPLGISGLLAPENRHTLLPMATAAVTGLINMFVLRPLTVNVMKERKHQGMPIAFPCFYLESILILCRNSRRQEEL